MTKRRQDLSVLLDLLETPDPPLRDPTGNTRQRAQAERTIEQHRQAWARYRAAPEPVQLALAVCRAALRAARSPEDFACQRLVKRLHAAMMLAMEHADAHSALRRLLLQAIEARDAAAVSRLVRDHMSLDGERGAIAMLRADKEWSDAFAYKPPDKRGKRCDRPTLFEEYADFQKYKKGGVTRGIDGLVCAALMDDLERFSKELEKYKPPDASKAKNKRGGVTGAVKVAVRFATLFNMFDAGARTKAQVRQAFKNAEKKD